MKTINNLRNEIKTLSDEYGIDANDIVINDGATNWNIETLVDESMSNFDSDNYGDDVQSFDDYCENIEVGEVENQNGNLAVFCDNDNTKELLTNSEKLTANQIKERCIEAGVPESNWDLTTDEHVTDMTVIDTINLWKETLENPVVCECCGKTYEYSDEPSEVKEGGTHLCDDCWNSDY
jgi:hypothetical protein